MPQPRAVNTTHITIRKPAPEKTSTPAIPCAIPTENGFIQEDPKPICVATYVTSTAMTVSYPTATNSGQRIMVNGRASSPIPNTAPPRENRTKRTGISSFSAPFALRIRPIRPASTAPVRIMIPKAPPTTIRNAMISMAELLIIPLYM